MRRTPSRTLIVLKRERQHTSRWRQGRRYEARRALIDQLHSSNLLRHCTSPTTGTLSQHLSHPLRNCCYPLTLYLRCNTRQCFQRRGPL